MARRSGDSEPDAKALCDTNVVFIDTNLDTHLALIVYHLDTVSDLKERILSEHPLCFPKIGQIQIHAIKVKRKGYFYHLSDSMFVRSAFSGFNKSWFLSVDASTLGEHGQNGQSFSPGSPNQVAHLGIANNALIGSFDNPLSCPSERVSNFNNFQLPQLENKQVEKEEIPVVRPHVSAHSRKEAVPNLETGVKSSGNNDPVIPLPGSIPETHVECEVYGSSKGIKDDNNVCEEGTLESVPSTKKKRKSKRKKEDEVQDDTSKENNVVGPGIDIVQKDIVVPQNPSDNELQIMHRIQLPGSIPHTQDYYCVNDELRSSHIECEVDESSKGIKDDCNVCEEGILKSVTSEKKKRKSKRRKEDKVQDDTSKENNTSIVGPSKDTVHQEMVVPENPSENADKEVSYEISIQENNMADGLCWDSSSNTRKRSSSRIPMSNEVIQETEVLKEDQHTECNNNNTKDNIDAECNESMKDASEPRPATNRKHKKRKRSLTHDSKEEMLKVEMASQKDEAGKQSKESKDQIEFNNGKSGDEVEFQHNKVTEEALDARAPAKKKLKGKDKSGDRGSFKEKQSGISDSNVENASHCSLEDQQKIKNSSADQSTEHFNDIGPLRTNVLGGRRKGKNNSSNPHQTAGVTSSRKDGESDHSRVQGGVQEEISEDCLISEDVSMSKSPVDNMIGTDACKEGIQCNVKRAGNPENHCAIDMKVQPSDMNEPKELTDNENIVLDHIHKSEAGQTEGAEEEREISPQNDPKPMLLEKCTPSNQDNADENIRELTVTSEVLDVSGITEPVKSEKKRRERRKAKDSDGGLALREGVGLIDASENETIIIKSLKTMTSDPTSGNNETEENPLNQTEGKNVQQEEMKGIFLSATDKEDDINANDAGSLEQIKTQASAAHVDKRQRKKSSNKQNSTDREDDIFADDAGFLEQIKTQAHADRVDKGQRKKSNNKQTSTANNVPYTLTKDKVLDCKNPSPSSDSRALAELSFNVTKKKKSASTKSTNKSGRTNLEANDAAKDSTRSSGDQDDNNLEASFKTDKINADQQSASLQQQHEAHVSDDMLGDKKNGADRTDLELMAGKNMHRLETTKGQTHTESLSSTQQLLSKEDGDVLRIHPNKKVLTVHRTGQEAKLSSLSNSITSSIEARRKPRVNTSGKSMDLEKQREHFPKSNSKLEGPKKMVQNKTGKAPGSNIRGVVNNTLQKKSLLTGAIFQDASSGTSEDEDDVDNSDASTRTPSDNSLLSDYSDGESSAGLSLQQNGSYGGKRLENGERSGIKAGVSVQKGVSIDHILRSSSRYKKAKITASQLEETESQAQFVPDSLADT